MKSAGRMRWLLAAYPRDWREEYGAAMEEMLERRHAEAANAGVLAVLRFWMRETTSAGWTGLRARARPASPNPSGSPGRGAGLNELRYAVRRLVRSPAFSVAAAGTLALAIGANVSIFTLVERVVIAPLPYEDQGALVHLDHELPGIGPGPVGMTQVLYVLYGDSRSLDGVALYSTGAAAFSTGIEPERLRSAMTTPELADILGVTPVRGRWFTDAEAGPDATRTVIISHRLWMRAFAGRPAIGETVTIDGVATEVIGVMPESFAFPDAQVDLWLPDRIDRADPRVGGFNYNGVARLAEGATLDAARREMDRRIATIPVDYPSEIATALIETGRLEARPITLKERTLGGVQATLWILLGSVGIVLLVACTNIANLLIARSETRQRELAVRRALGSGRRGLVSFYLSESIVLAGIGGLAGVLLGYGGLRLLLTSTALPIPRLHEVRFDTTVLLFAIALTVAAALAFTVVPLLRRPPLLASALREGGRGSSTGRARLRARSFLMGAQVALALILLVAGGLMLRSFMTLRAIHPGFDRSSALTFRLGLPAADYPADEPERAAIVWRELVERLEALPGVNAAAATTCLPLEGFCYGDPLEVDGAVRQPGEIPPIITMRRVTPDYFDVMGMPILAGRSFDERDIAAGSRPAVISRRLADLYFPDGSPLGRRIHPAFGEDNLDWYTVVGVVGDVPTNTLRESTPVPSAYFPPVETFESVPSLNGVAFVVRSDVPPLALVEAARSTVAALDPGLPLASVRTLEAIVQGDSARTAFTMTLLLIASAVALLLGIVGIYGVIAYLVGQRRSEIGIRLVLGARPEEVASMIVKQGGIPTALGMLAGLATALSVGGLIESLLFRVDARDPLTYAVVILLLGSVALLACWLPARRAARLDPASTLRG